MIDEADADHRDYIYWVLSSSVVDPDPELEVMIPAPDPELDLNLTKIHKKKTNICNLINTGTGMTLIMHYR
jgi:hypothetical protein